MMYALQPRLDMFPALWRSCSLRSCQSGEDLLKYFARSASSPNFKFSLPLCAVVCRCVPISPPLTIQVQLDLLIRRLAREYQADAEDVRVLTTLVDNMKKTRK